MRGHLSPDSWGVIVILSLLLVACLPPNHTDKQVSRGGRENPAPKRVVSLDYCADQYTLHLLDSEQIAALSPDSRSDYSYLAPQAAGHLQVRPVAEDVLALKPDLIMRSYGGGPGAAAFYKRIGIPVITIPWAARFSDVLNALETVAGDLGAPDKAAATRRAAEARLAALKQASPFKDGAVGQGAHARTDPAQGKRHVLYATPGGVTTGPGSLIHEIIQKAGHQNYEIRPGWHALPLERLVTHKPDLVALSFFTSPMADSSPWSPARHPVFTRLMHERPSLELKAAWTACGGWFMLDAIEALSSA